MKMEGRLAVFVLAALAVAGCRSSGHRPVAAAPPNQIDVVSPIRRYDVEIRPSLSELFVKGRARIYLDAAAEQGWPIRIPRHDLVVERVDVDGVTATIPKDQEFLTIPRSTTVEIDFSGRPKRGLALSGQTLYSVFSTSHWMPCLEEPSVRAPLTLTLVLPASVEAVATGQLVSRTSRPRAPDSGAVEDPMAWRFELDAPYPSYLYGFAVGPFVRATAMRGAVELVAVGDGISQDRLQLLLEATGPMLDFFAERAGVPYPLRSYTQVVVPGDVAQEMAGLSVLGIDGMTQVLGIEPASDSATEAVAVDDWLPAHELSHAWWGNLITCRNWDHFWLNEGFAVFMTAAWKQRRWGDPGYDIEMNRARARWKRAQDAGVDHPLSYGGPYPSRGLRNSIVYSKGALFLDALRRATGEASFWRGLREYTRTHRGRGVVSGDFERDMQKATGTDLRPLFREWVDSPGM